MSSIYRNSLNIHAQTYEQAKPLVDLITTLLLGDSDCWRINWEDVKEGIVCQCEFDTYLRPPFNVYERLDNLVKSNEGITVEATCRDEANWDNRRLDWVFNGDEYEGIETDLTYSKEEKAELENINYSIQLSYDVFLELMNKLRAHHDGINQVIFALEKLCFESMFGTP